MVVVHAISVSSQWDYWDIALGVLRPDLTDWEPLGIGGWGGFQRFFRPTLLGFFRGTLKHWKYAYAWDGSHVETGSVLSLNFCEKYI